MQAVIMAGGRGTRLATITKNEVPKPMVDILGKPLLERQIEILKKNGITDVIFIIGYLGNVIRNYFGNGSKFGITAQYIEENEPLGTAGSFYFLKNKLDGEPFFLIFGDVLFDIDLGRMFDFHRKNRSLATLFVHPNSHPFDSDLVEVDSEGKILKFDSKHNMRNYWYKNCVNAGLYILNPEICNLVSNPAKKDLEKDILSKVIAEGRDVFGYKSPEYVKDVGTVERINSAKKDIESGFIEKRSLRNKQKCIFLDRDGTLNVYKGLISKIEEFELEKDVVEAIKKINSSEWICVVVTNQPVVARGMCSIDDVNEIHKKMETLLGKDGAYLDDMFFCPHHPDKGFPEENPAYKIKCHCRKPAIGMLETAAEKYNIDLNASWIVGDTTMDIQTGLNAGCHTALVMTGEAGKDGKFNVKPEVTGSSLLEVVKKIIGEKND
ncbi:HAD-IIIA family hydrolase [Treponema zioleckii]|uniref:HAD-IIIA family hydrolase n=1 Tax=Treponema zioleckii TaxID=331680 RepID=UPI0018D9737E|nr:HAD-IIIA family hydrolase [Treponema zioleckii]